MNILIAPTYLIDMKLSERRLRRGAEHVYYEISMFYLTTREFSNNLNYTNEMAMLESWCIHLRNLLVFFYTPSDKRKFGDDILAEDYVSELRQFKRGRARASKFNHIEKRVAKQIAHLTYHRNVYNKKTKPWHYQDIFTRLKPTISAFYESLPKHRKKWLHFVELKKFIYAH